MGFYYRFASFKTTKNMELAFEKTTKRACMVVDTDLYARQIVKTARASDASAEMSAT